VTLSLNLPLLITVPQSVNLLSPWPACLIDLSWGRILGRNWDISLKSFPPCYLQSTLLTNCTHPPYWAKLVFKHWIRKSQVWELSRLCPETSAKLYVHEFGFRTHTDTRGTANENCDEYCSYGVARPIVNTTLQPPPPPTSPRHPPPSPQPKGWVLSFMSTSIVTHT
jgi:hypothetical protein